MQEVRNLGQCVPDIFHEPDAPRLQGVGYRTDSVHGTILLGTLIPDVWA